MTFSKYLPTDRLVEEYIRGGKYSIDDINLELYNKGLPVLGYSRY